MVAASPRLFGVPILRKASPRISCQARGLGAPGA